MGAGARAGMRKGSTSLSSSSAAVPIPFLARRHGSELVWPSPSYIVRIRPWPPTARADARLLVFDVVAVASGLTLDMGKERPDPLALCPPGSFAPPLIIGCGEFGEGGHAHGERWIRGSRTRGGRRGQGRSRGLRPWPTARERELRKG